MCGTLMYQASADLENMCADMADDLSRLDYCVIKILELSAITTETQERMLLFVQSRPEIYSCADIACDYSSRLKSALESLRNQLSGCEMTEAQGGQNDDLTH